MIQPLRPKPNLGRVADKAKAAFQNRPGFPAGPAAQAAKDRLQAALARMQSSPLAGTPLGQAIQQFLLDRLSKGEDLEEFLEELRARAREEIDKRRHIVACLAEAVELLRGQDKLFLIRRDVIQAARTGQVQGAEAWDRLDRILKTPFPFLSMIERRVGPFTIAVALQAKGGLAAGVGLAEGISGLRHCLACHFQQVSVAVGAIAGVDFGAQLSVAPGKPASGVTFSVEAGGGGGYGASAGASVAFTPTPRRPTLQDSRLFDYEFAGLAVGLGGGGGLDISVAFGVTHSQILGGGLA